ncbi:MAG TPA: EAL domain-containing protein [Rhodanobacteraceae bacterium]|nr:EAL domain-containing protein [Rhodanobacteraceae bacterium]
MARKRTWQGVNGILLVVAIVAALTSIVLAAISWRRQWLITRELQISRERYRLVAEGANDGIFDFDILDRKIFFSPRVYQMLGYDQSELNSPADLERIMLPEDYPAARAALYEHMEAHRTDELRRVMRMRARDGRVLTILARSVASYAADGTPVRMAGSYTDITEQLGNERQLQIAASVFEAGSDGIVISDAHDRILSVNRAFLGMTGYTHEELIGRLLREVQVESDAVRIREQALRDAASWIGEVAWRRHNGEVKTLETSTDAVRDAAGEVIFRIHVCIDTAELRYAQARIRHLAYFDSLTGLPNRTHLRGQFEQALATARYAGQPVAVVFFDLDNFKEINDTAGHSVGDDVICAVAQRLGQNMREDDILCRFGGDEFLLLMPNTDAAAAEVLTGQLMEQLCKPVEVEGRLLDIAASAGFSMFPDDAQDAENLVREADTALFRAKEEGGNAVLRFQPWMGEAVSWRHDMQAALRVAIVRSQFTLRFQPIVDARAHRLAGVEALLYWNRPGMGVVGPATFISLAEESRLIEPIGAWVVNEVCRQVAVWKRDDLPPFYVAVNVSGLQLRVAGKFQQHLTDAMKRHGVVNDDLVLEITERHLVQDVKGGLPVLESLTASGIRVSVDDFGTGYSNLESLKNLTVHQIKIDRTFVRNLMTEVGDRAIVKSIIALGRSLGLQVVAEGVENREQQQLLREFGCDLLQGYLYARPMAAVDVPPFVDALVGHQARVQTGG